MISSCIGEFIVAANCSVVKLRVFFTQVGMPETQDVVNYCADNKVLPQIQIIDASQVNDAWEKVVNKEARYRCVIDAATF